MTAVQDNATSAPAVDPDKLMAFVFRAVDEVGAALNGALVVMGDRLGYYRSLAQHGASTPAELAEHTGTDKHYAREWLNAQAAGSFVDYDPPTGRYHLPPEQAVALTDDTSPAFVGGLFQLAHGTICDTARIVTAAQTGDGLGWGQHHPDVHVGCERFFAPTYAAHLVTDWLPALHGVVDKLIAGAAVADVGCGHGASTILMSQAFPGSTFRGTDSHPGSIATARERARQSGAESQTRFETADAATFTGGPYDLVTMFDCLHDMGDPISAARHVREVIADDGTWMIVEPATGDHVEDNFTPIGRTYYGFSTLVCTPSSLAQPVGLALGTQAGPARIKTWSPRPDSADSEWPHRPRSITSSKFDPDPPQQIYTLTHPNRSTPDRSITMKYFIDTHDKNKGSFPNQELTEEQFFEQFAALEEAAGQFGVFGHAAHVNLREGKAFCFMSGPDQESIRKAHAAIDLPYDSITEVRRVTGADMRIPQPAQAQKRNAS